MKVKPNTPFLFGVGVVLFLPALVILVMQIVELRQDREQVETATLTRAEQVSLLADLQIQSELTSLEFLLRTPALQRRDWDVARTAIEEIRQINTGWVNVMVFDPLTQSVLLAIEDQPLLGVPPEVQTLAPMQTLVGGATSRSAGCSCIHLYGSVRDVSGSMLAVAVAIDGQAFQNILMQRVPENTIAAIVDRDGRFVARSIDPQRYIGLEATVFVRTAIRAAEQGVYRGVTYEGFENYTAYVTSSQTGWSVHIAIASFLIDAPRLWSVMLVIVATLIALTAAGALVLYFLRHAQGIAAAHLAAIVQCSEDAIIGTKLDGTITAWNESAEEILGFSEQEALDKHISLVIPNERMAEERNVVARIRQGERVAPYETLRRHKNGDLVSMSIAVSPIKNEKGDIIGASMVGRDISERQATERELLEERETLMALNELAPLLTASLDLHSLVQTVTDESTRLIGAQFGAFFYNVINTGGESYMLYTLSGAARESFENFGMPRATDVFGPTFRGEGTLLAYDITADPRYGRNSPHHGMPPGHLPVRSYLAVSVMSRSGEVIGGLFFGHSDVGVFTEREAKLVEGIAALAATGIDNARLYDEVREGRKKAEEANRAKSDFLATMSHEIRTPMNAIVGISSILAMSGTLSPKQQEFVKTLRTSADALMGLINDLLDISRIEARTLELEEVPFSLHEIITEVVNMTKMRAVEKGIDLSARTHPAQDYLFVGDPTRLRQIIVNLVSNAVKFTEKGSVLVEVDCEASDVLGVINTRIMVSDTGIGIASDKIGTIFDKFVQGDTSISRKYGGSGLGLSITRSLVQAMGGEISVDSSLSRGSTFTVHLPLRVAAEVAVAQVKEDRFATASTVVTTGPRVLLVEDHEPNILVARTFLDALGYRYEVARNGQQAVERVKKEAFDIILMDVQMPVMNGLDATRAIRELEIRKGRNPCFIIGVTAHALRGDRERCLAEGMDDYMSKPFGLSELKERIERGRNQEAESST